MYPFRYVVEARLPVDSTFASFHGWTEGMAYDWFLSGYEHTANASFLTLENARLDAAKLYPTLYGLPIILELDELDVITRIIEFEPTEELRVLRMENRLDV